MPFHAEAYRKVYRGLSARTKKQLAHKASWEHMSVSSVMRSWWPRLWRKVERESERLFARDDRARKRLVPSLERIREHFQKKLHFYPTAYLLNPVDFGRAGKRRYKGAVLKPDETVERTVIVGMDGRAYTTWKFNREIRGLPV